MPADLPPEVEARLLPCPFCGGKAGASDYNGSWAVGCLKCGIWTRGVIRAECIAAWNRRAGLSTSSEDAAKEDADILTVAVERGAIVVRLPFATVPYAVSAAPWNIDDDCNQRYEVTSVQAFAAEVVQALKDEEEDGTTLVHVMFDAAFEHVVEQGGEGIDAIRAARRSDRGEG